ncbi:MAG: hypothetical protein AAGB22_10150 [Bacteroidota bacterium]
MTERTNNPLPAHLLKATLLLLAGCCWLGMPGAFSQSVTEELQLLYAAFEDQKAIAMDVTYSLYREGEAQPFDRETGSMAREGDRLYVKQFDSETIITGKYAIQVDHDNKWLIMQKAGNGKTSKADAALFSALPEISPEQGDSVLLAMYIPEFIPDVAANQRGILFQLPAGGQYKDARVWYGKDDHLIQRIEMRSRYPQNVQGQTHQVRVVIEYSNVRVDGNVSDTQFSESPYVERKDGKLQPTARYQDYRFFNYL